MEGSRWKRCSSCKGDIAFGATYWVCNVSTCNRSRTALFFCSVSCWDVHLGVVNHRESWAVERRAPSREQWQRAEGAAAPSARVPAAPVAPAASPAPERSARRILVQPAAESSRRKPDPVPREILIVASKLKAYVRARSGFHTSDRALEPLSEAVRELCERAIAKARAEGRRTLLERDFEE